MEKQDVGGWTLEDISIYFYFTFLKHPAPSNNKCKFKAFFFFCKDAFVLKPNLAKLFKDLFLSSGVNLIYSLSLFSRTKREALKLSLPQVMCISQQNTF